MSRHWIQGTYIPQHPEKWINNKPIRGMSSWETRVFQVLDMNPAVTKIGSEVLQIPYYHPLKKKTCLYIPDILVEIVNSKGKRVTYLYEIKPAKEAMVSKAKSRYDKLSLLVNMFKWKAAYKFCQERGIIFKVLTEEQLFKI